MVGRGGIGVVGGGKEAQGGGGRGKGQGGRGRGDVQMLGKRGLEGGGWEGRKGRQRGEMEEEGKERRGGWREGGGRGDARLGGNRSIGVEIVVCELWSCHSYYTSLPLSVIFMRSCLSRSVTCAPTRCGRRAWAPHPPPHYPPTLRPPPAASPLAPEPVPLCPLPWGQVVSEPVPLLDHMSLRFRSAS